MSFQTSTKHTVASLRTNRDKHKYAMLRIETLDEAAAAEAAGVELLSIPPAMMMDQRFRKLCPTAFVFPGDHWWNIGGPDEFLKWAMPLVAHGADAVYCGGSLQSIKLLAEHGVPACGHVGLVPPKWTWTGGAKAVGKTLDGAKRIWDQCRELEDAGAFAAEIEVVPDAIAAAIAERTSLFLLSMGGGASGNAQYLFSDDVLGQNRGRIPRHAKVYADFASEFDRLQNMRVGAMRAFANDVHGGEFPSSPHLVTAEADVIAEFREWLGNDN
ncbi:3-methyl-2-oxobutanoate hydroxymethyltransferase [Tabrizicola fusiformis]|jgi:3-methyl-2-oxobutanoate hydroxymethyltransferase|uniref:3-methyl-2-oxobutanoate hydroxymethyltransferase n=1 Tax=Tabrizicola sp. SY72 TaxID=2741673 RepID=UPI001572A38C|nr:3-methyl-2-oxobutanoate hydroxymethyltransferase [Tabrizicola sp. SY72]NTT88019.1 3-methyl-2-oxobutanoate hydroxymethyltransferase [Tabrizicola sp. SY72]